jgi:uncharacterized membrane protein YuzA (DUF378 family)
MPSLLLIVVGLAALLVVGRHRFDLRAQELAGEGEIGVGAGDVGGQALALGLIDHVAIDIVPVVFGRGSRTAGRSLTAT